MSDNVTTPISVETFAFDEISAVKHQRVKVEYGDDGSATDVSAANPLPVTFTSSNVAATSDSIAAYQVTGGIVLAGTLTLLTPKFAKISCSNSGVNIVVAAVTSKKIRVLGWDLSAAGTVNVKWQSHTTPTDLTGLYYEVANTGIAKSFSPTGYFESLSGESLDLNLSGAVAVGGSLVYIEV